MKRKRTRATSVNIERFRKTIKISDLTCKSCNLIWVQRIDVSIGILDNNLCSTCSFKSEQRQTRCLEQDDPFDLRNWIQRRVEIKDFDCAGDCGSDVDFNYCLSECVNGDIPVMQNTHKSDIHFCAECFLTRCTHEEEKQNLKQ